MILLIAAACFLSFQGNSVTQFETAEPQESAKWKQVKLPNPDGSLPSGCVYQLMDRLDPPQFSPKKFGESAKPWEFDWVEAVVATDMNISSEKAQSYQTRFRIFSQERKSQGDRSVDIGRMFLRLWELNFKNLRIDHADRYHKGIVDVYLCWGGTPGGEQLFDVEEVDKRQYKVNTIYIYDVHSFTDPIEMAREIAHEYGHAALPAVGGFKQPEEWANGYLGEKLYLTWMRDEMAKKRLGPDDAMGATQEQLDAWVQKNVQPLVLQAALNGPELEKLKGEQKDSMDSYVGLNLWMFQEMPTSVFARSLLLIGSEKAADYVDSAVLAVEEPDQIRLNIPKELEGKAIWVPVGTDTVFNAKVLARRKGWEKLQPTGPVILFRKPR